MMPVPLFVEVSAGGGDVIVRQARWSSGKAAFLGGGVVTFLLMTDKGRVVTGGSRSLVHRIDYDLDDKKALQTPGP